MIKEKIYEKIRARGTRKHHEKQNEFVVHPSGVCGCQRALWYKFSGVEPTNPPLDAGLEKMWMGEILHGALNDLLHDGHFTPGESKKGAIDGVLYVYEPDGIIEMDGKKWVVEFKTVFLGGWNTVQNEPKPEHLTQLAIYMQLEEADAGVLLYLDRGSGHMIEYSLTRGAKFDALLQDAKKRVRELQGNLAAGIPPEPEFPIFIKRVPGGGMSFDFTKDGKAYKTGFPCRWGKMDTCAYFDLCRKNYVEPILEGLADFNLDGHLIGGAE